MADLVVVHESEREKDSYGGYSSKGRVVRIWMLDEGMNGRVIYFKQYGESGYDEVEWEKTMTPTTGKAKTVVEYVWDED